METNEKLNVIPSRTDDFMFSREHQQENLCDKYPVAFSWNYEVRAGKSRTGKRLYTSTCDTEIFERGFPYGNEAFSAESQGAMLKEQLSYLSKILLNELNIDLEKIKGLSGVIGEYSHLDSQFIARTLSGSEIDKKHALGVKKAYLCVTSSLDKIVMLFLVTERNGNKKAPWKNYEIMCTLTKGEDGYEPNWLFPVESKVVNEKKSKVVDTRRGVILAKARRRLGRSTEKDSDGDPTDFDK